MASKLKLAPSNVYHFETKNKTNKRNPFQSDSNNLTETALKYAKVLGFKKITIEL